METSVTGSKNAITFVVMAAALMALIDITIVNVALNDIRTRESTVAVIRTSAAVMGSRQC